jgi:hypothetical protein
MPHSSRLARSTRAVTRHRHKTGNGQAFAFASSMAQAFAFASSMAQAFAFASSMAQAFAFAAALACFLNDRTFSSDPASTTSATDMCVPALP